MMPKPPIAPTKVVLAYSGGLDTSVMLHWMRGTYHCDVVCFCADVGQGKELAGLEEKALATGAQKLIVRDLKEEFVRDYVWTALKANAVYEGTYLLGTSLARPLIAKHQIEVARSCGADAVAHGATGKGNDQARFELGFAALAPDLQVIAPWRTWEFAGRSDLIAYAAQHNIPIPVSTQDPYSMDRNLMHISYEGGILEDPWTEPAESMFRMTAAPENASATPQTIVVSFEGGIPVAVDGTALSPAALLERCNALGGEHGIGRVDIVENRFVGMKSRGVYETPGMTILLAAHRALESITLDREVMRLKESLGLKFAESIYYGFWFAPEFDAMRALIDHTQERVTGDVRLNLYRGNATITGRRSPHALYNPELATFEADTLYRQGDAEGFIRLQGLRLMAAKGLPVTRS